MRGLDRNINKKLNKKDLEELLKNHLAGISRAPALCFGNEFISMEKSHLSEYEVMPIEPLHDSKGHIKNLWDVLPEILDEKEKKLFLDSLDSCYGGKDKIRGSDYRLSTIVVYQIMKGKCHADVEDLLYTLMEMIRLAYLKSDHRSPKVVLRLYNTTFRHIVLMQSVLGKNPKAITREKLYGIYYHSLTTHLPEVSRIIAPSSLHTENEEMIFSKINQISLSTSSRSLESIRDNSILRIQAEQKFKGFQRSKSSSSSKISKFGKSVGT